jgi:hypothetical protein
MVRLRKIHLISVAGLVLLPLTAGTALAGTCYYEQYNSASGQWEHVRERFVGSSQECIARCSSSGYRNCSWSPSDN